MKRALSRVYARVFKKSPAQSDKGDEKVHLRREKPNGIRKMVAVVALLTTFVFLGSYWLGYFFASLLGGWELFGKLCGFALFVVIGRLWVRDVIPYLVSQMVFHVPAAHFAVRILFGKRRKGYLLEGGPYFKWPDFIEKTEHISLELVKISVETRFVTHDNLEVEITGSPQFRPDPDVVNKGGQVIYFEMSEEIIVSGIADVLKAKLGGLGGVQTGEDFTHRRQSVEEVVNHILRTETPRHLRHEVDCREQIQAGEVLVPCQWRSIEKIDAPDILDFYTAHWRIAKNDTDCEKQAVHERSKIESRYGIDIEFFALSEVRFSPKTMEALEVLQQAKLREKRHDLMIGMAERLGRFGDTSPETAINVAHAMIDPDIAKNRRIVSLEGLGSGAAPVVVLGDLGGHESAANGNDRRERAEREPRNKGGRGEKKEGKK